MPANLTPQYQKAEEAYRRAQSPQERLACLEEMLVLIPKHKGTEKLQADLKTRLKETRAEVQAEVSAPKAGKSYRFPRQGAGTAVVIGAPNAGKSRLIAELTAAQPAVEPYPFTTHEPLPAMMPWEDVSVQLIDTPPITADHLEPYVTGLVRSADLVLLCCDGSSDDMPEQTAAVIDQFARRKTVLDAHSGFDEEDFSIVHVRSRLVVTRAANPDVAIRLDFLKEATPLRFAALHVEFEDRDQTERLRGEIFDALDVIRIYTKRPGKPAEMESPFTIPRGGTVEDLAGKVHRDFIENLKFAKVWGGDGPDGRSVGREYVLSEGEIVELHA